MKKVIVLAAVLAALVFAVDHSVTSGTVEEARELGLWARHFVVAAIFGIALVLGAKLAARKLV